MNIKVLGTKGCKNCEMLHQKLEKLIEEKQYDASLEKVTSINDIAKYKITSIPGLVIDEKVILEGIVPKNEDLEYIIENGKVKENIVNEAECVDGFCRF